MCHRRTRYLHSSGFSLIELLLVIVVLGIAASTLMVVSTQSAAMSSSIMRQQQARSLAEGLLEEIQAMPFTYCEPSQDVFGAGNAANVGACAVKEDTVPLAREPGEFRWNAVAVNRFDNVNDYNGLTIAAGALTDASNNAMAARLPSVSNCQLQVAVTANAIAALGADSQRIAVTVTCPDLLTPVVAEGIRIRYAPHRYQF
ncbi:MAG: prepilin-type N-terminal cleavage/methylation domain-containing protein [Burkholderiales bacterium]|nr:prepilin-type N-terminal cleavage/methylation domain-containing protein [Burkholderiales bacterium]